MARNGSDLTFASIGIATPFLMFIYIVAMRSSHRYEGAQPGSLESPVDYSAITLNQALVRYIAAAAAIVIAAALLPVAAVEISRLMGWQQAFVGSLFVAAATSLPEAAVSISALRMRALDLAIANLLGSNLFNILILAIDDVAYRRGSLYSAASDVHVVTALLGIIMSGIVVVALLSRASHRVRGLFGWASIVLLLVYVFGTMSIYLMSG